MYILPLIFIACLTTGECFSSNRAPEVREPVPYGTDLEAPRRGMRDPRVRTTND
ncbi:hypothetical protein BOW86_gp052 [Synechococcus phage S-CAM7]|uniref:Uncharacterized protein n=1 Tax=Synechococcus phage S-CAM7 TaxID=1883368 RepID=A0A1D8KUA3_9CAUD|nr:hypothetical protein BOW86_gp052 [Synechococcus phage S-CAM7]AOV61976.1 hypothetical protein C490910_052 [Synechococcus phage S-CAM7]AOV62241.1 hypothetical protein S420910_051 [Synechococcus phage S-CAM7]QLF86104.1 hypothetical protein CC030809_00048 [Synechococcus phage S-CAM7]